MERERNRDKKRGGVRGRRKVRDRWGEGKREVREGVEER